MSFISKLKKLYQEKIVLDAMEADSIDVSEEVANIEKKIATAVAMEKCLEVVDYYKKRGRWKSGNSLTDDQKAVVRSLKSLNARTIVKELLS